MIIETLDTLVRKLENVCLTLRKKKQLLPFLKGRSNSYDESSRRYEDDERNYYSDDGTLFSKEF